MSIKYDIFRTRNDNLFSELRYQLIADKIRELNNAEYMKLPKGHTADVVLTNFQFETQPRSARKHDLTEFFVLAISHNTELFVTKAITPVEGKLVFTEKFCFRNVDENFSVKVEVFSMKLKTERSMVDTLLRKVCHNHIIFVISREILKK